MKRGMARSVKRASDRLRHTLHTLHTCTLLGASTIVGFPSRAMSCDIANVLPVPVAPLSTSRRFPAASASLNVSTADDCSAEGGHGDTSSKPVLIGGGRLTKRAAISRRTSRVASRAASDGTSAAAASAAAASAAAASAAAAPPAGVPVVACTFERSRVVLTTNGAVVAEGARGRVEVSEEMLPD